MIVRQGRVLFDGGLDEARERAHAGAGSDLEQVFFAVTDGADGAMDADAADAHTAPDPARDSA
jgi:hypothetical protein